MGLFNGPFNDTAYPSDCAVYGLCCGRSLAGILGSNPVAGMAVFLL